MSPIFDDHLALLDHGVQGADASPISGRHPVNFVHDKTRFICYGHSKGVRCLQNQPQLINHNGQGPMINPQKHREQNHLATYC